MTTKSTARTVAAIALPAGTAAEAASIATHSTPVAISGLAIVIAGVAAIVVQVIDRAVRDTTEERRRLQAAEDNAQAEYLRLFAARSVLDAETERVLRLLENEDRKRAARYQEMHDELLADVEDRKAALKQEGYLLAIDHRDRGLHSLPAQPINEAQIVKLPRRAAVGSNSAPAPEAH